MLNHPVVPELGLPEEAGDIINPLSPILMFPGFRGHDPSSWPFLLRDESMRTWRLQIRGPQGRLPGGSPPVRDLVTCTASRARFL